MKHRISDCRRRCPLWFFALFFASFSLSSAFLFPSHQGQHFPCPPLHYSSKTGGRLLESVPEYESAIGQDKPVLVFWTAPWCGPCRLTIPVVKAIKQQFASQLVTYEICTDDMPGCAADAGVVSVPTIHLYYKGELLDTLVGCVAKQVLAGSVEKVLEDIAARPDSKAA